MSKIKNKAKSKHKQHPRDLMSHRGDGPTLMMTRPTADKLGVGQKQQADAERIVGAAERGDADDVMRAIADIFGERMGIKPDTALGSVLKPTHKNLKVEWEPKELVVEKKAKTFLHDAILLQDVDPEKMFRRQGIDPKNLKGMDFFVKMFHRYALRVKAAEKYVLDRAAIAHIVEAANVGPQGRQWASYWDSVMMMARLPHQRVFVEFDIDEFNDLKQANGSYHPTDNKPVGGRGGYLLERLTPDDPTRWTAQFCLYTDNNDSFIHFGGVGYMLGTEDEELPLVNSDDVEKLDRYYLSEYHDMGLLGKRETMADPDHMIRYMHDFSWGIYRSVDKEGNPIPLVTERMRRSLRLMLPSIVGALIIMPKGMDESEYHGRRVMEAVRDGRGDVRHLLAFFALLNAVPVQNVIREPQGARTIGTRVIRRQSHNQVNFINLRKTEVVKQLHKATREYAKKRNHAVRMHLRSIWFPQGPVCSVTEHRSLSIYDAAPDFGSKYVRCKQCGVVRRWVTDHRRGDASLGTVDHPHGFGITSHD